MKQLAVNRCVDAIKTVSYLTMTRLLDFTFDQFIVITLASSHILVTTRTRHFAVDEMKTTKKTAVSHSGSFCKGPSRPCLRPALNVGPYMLLVHCIQVMRELSSTISSCLRWLCSVPIRLQSSSTNITSLKFEILLK